MGSFSLWHWLIVLLIVVLIFGTKKLRNIGSDVGGAVKEFKKAMNDKIDMAWLTRPTGDPFTDVGGYVIKHLMEKL